MGNAGIKDSTEKTVEMLFDSSAIGVMGLHVPYRVGEKLTSVQFTTTANPVWTTATINSTASSVGKAWISYRSLGITSRSEFITGIRYDFGIVPASTFYCVSQSTPPYWNGFDFYGKWIGNNDTTTTGTSSIRVYDTDPLGTHDTGIGYITT
jgi:hypothetical protein